MENAVAESSYPVRFRKDDATLLGEYLRHRHNVVIVGMKRVGISNFLRFFLFHPQAQETYVDRTQKHLFIPVDLNDLVERELYPFWTLTFKRIVDEVDSADLSDGIKQKIASSFLSAIQSQDLFLLIDGVRRSLSLLVEEGYLPTLFLLRFDRMKKAVTPEFFDNLQGMQDAAHQKLSFVFTSYRSLDALSPEVVNKASLAAFSQIMYLKPLSLSDMEIMYEQYEKRYGLSLPPRLKHDLFTLVGGDVQYLQLAFIALNEKKDISLTSTDDLSDLLLRDERLLLQSEELWESLTNEEKEVLTKVVLEEEVRKDEKKSVPYIVETGMVREGKTLSVFSPILSHYVRLQATSPQRNKDIAFSKKEHLLFTTLHEHLGEIREREDIIEAVWPEYREFGVSDWSIDRLVARVRAKLKQQDSPFEIKTIRTRGYVLISKV